LSAEHDVMVTKGRSGSAEIRRVSDGGLVAKIGPEHTAESAAVSADGAMVLLTVRQVGTALVEATTGRVVRALAQPVLGTCCAFSGDGTLAAIGCMDGRVRVREVASGELVVEMQGHAADVRCVVFSRDGRRVLSAANDSTLRVWEVESGEEVGRLRPHTN